MGRDATLTRERLLRAGERLFAQHGIDGVRVREVNQLAGQRNSSALHYHFGSREGLLEAILDRRREPIETRRAAMLDALVAAGRADDLRALVETIVMPFAAELATESGRDYLRILPQVMGRRGVSVGLIPDTFGPAGIRRTLRLAHQCLPDLPRVLREERLALTMEVLVYALGRRAQEIELGLPFRMPEERFVANIVDMAVGALLAPVGRADPAPRPAPK